MWTSAQKTPQIKDLETSNVRDGISSKPAFSSQASSPKLIRVGLATARIMPGSPSHPPYVKGGGGAANDSGLDLPLEKDDLAISSSNAEGAIPHSANVAASGTESPVNTNNEVMNTV
jgi:hypothetical protein